MFGTFHIGKRALRRLTDAIFIAAAAGVGGYFFYAATAGDYGAAARAEIKIKEDALRSEAAGLRLSADALANKTHRLSDEYLDLDLLDEEIRAVLGYIGPNDYVLPAQ
jgi:cell division protein FtsB